MGDSSSLIISSTVRDDPWDRILDLVPLETLVSAIQRRIRGLESKRDELAREVIRKKSLLTGGSAREIVNDRLTGEAAIRNGNEVAEEEEEEEERPVAVQVVGNFFGEEEDEDAVAVDLFTNEQVEGGADEVIRRTLEIHGFDLVTFVKTRLEEDPLAMARTVNFVRSQVALKAISKEEIVRKVYENADQWQQDERYLVPVLGNGDPLLWWGDAFSEPDDGDLVDGPEDDDDDNEDADEPEYEGLEEETDEVF